VTDPTNEDAPHFEIESGYLDVTNKFTVEPDEIEFSWGKIKRCVITSFFTGTSTYDCNPQEATIRTSFAKVQPDEDFEPFEDNYAWKDVVGNTGAEGNGYNPWLGSARTTWDPQYGFNDAQTHRLKSIHNTWQKSHQAATCSDNTDADHDGTADACANSVTGYKGHNGSQCDTIIGKCTIPVRDRSIKTIAYTLNKEAPDAFQDKVDGGGRVIEQGVLEQMGASWGQLLEVAIAYRREVECRRTHDGDRDSCHSQFFESDLTPAGKQVVKVGGWLTDKPKPQDVDKGKPMFYVCHNPVRSYDPEDLCGKPGTSLRFGDIRRNWLVYWPYESRARYGGVGWNPSDPVTGETWGATATIMGRSVTRAAALQRDVIQLAMGDTKIEDILVGAPADRYARMLKDGASAPEGMRIGKTPEEIAARVGAVDLNNLRSSIAVRPPTTASQLEDAKLDSIAKMKSTVAGEQFKGDIAKFDVLTGRLKGSVQMLDEVASPLRGLEPAKMEALRAWYEEDMAAKGACFQEAMQTGTGSLYLPSLAGWFRAKYGDLDPKTRGERIYDDLVKETIKGIGIHEMGHSLGLRHNFASSWDAPNFNPQYWQLRTNEGKATAACNGPRKGDEDTCMGPRYLDPMTRDEQGLAGESRPGIDYFANTSTMEYQIERGGESIGLGTYDQHAMKVLYGRVIETLDDRIIPSKEQNNFALKNYTQLQERDLVLNGNSVFTHYTTTGRLLKIFDPNRDCRPATDQEKAENAWRVVHGKVCAPPTKDHGAFGDFESGPDPIINSLNLVKWRVKDGNKSLVRWNYRWGEQYGAGGYMHTTMMDAGADVYELTQNLTRSFDLRYPWTYFRRGDREYNDMFLPQAVASQYFGRLRAYHWQVALGMARAKAADLSSDDGMRPYVMAQADIFNFLTRAALMPEPGDYAPSGRGAPGGRQIFDLLQSNGGGVTPQAAFTIGIGDGRYIAVDFDNEKGGSWNYQQYVAHAGYETEKALALMQIVDPRPTLFTVARENYLDGRDVMISFRNDLPDGVDRLLGGVLSEDWESIAPHVVGDASSGIQGFDITQKALSRPQGAMLVFPNVGYKQELSMAIYGALFSRLSSDMTLVNKMRIWMDGDKAPVIPGTREIRFTNPESGYTYVASKYGDEALDGHTTDRGIGSRMLARANQLLAQAYQVKLDANGKTILDEKGQPQLVLDASGRPIVNGPDAQIQFRRYIGLVDATRQIGRVLDGPLGGGGGGGDD
jgi:hypothetical protein